MARLMLGKGQIALVIRVMLPPALRSSQVCLSQLCGRFLEQDFALVGASPGMKVDELKRKVEELLLAGSHLLLF